MVTIPDGSIYIWMYKQGLKQVDLCEIESACRMAGKEIRSKDYDNYWNGYHKSVLYHGPARDDFLLIKEHISPSASEGYFERDYLTYESNPFYGTQPDIQNRWVPCSKENKPLIKWGDGCMEMADAVAYRNQVYLAENLKGTRFIVIDCDGDHDDPWDYETIMFLNRYKSTTHCIEKPTAIGWETSPSFHLTFETSLIIPTMHFPWAHIDIAGNRKNQLRYWKNKQWNGLPPAFMTSEIWNDIRKYIKYRKEKADAAGYESAGYADSSSSEDNNDQGGVRQDYA